MTESSSCESSVAVPDLPVDSKLIEEVASGQKMVIYAVLVNIIAYALSMMISPLLGLVALAGAVLAILGIIRLCTGMGMSTVVIMLTSRLCGVQQSAYSFYLAGGPR